MKIFLAKTFSIIIPVSFVITYIALTFSIAPSKIFNINIINEHKFNKTLYIDPGFPLEEQEKINTAAKNWNTQTKGIINFDVKLLTGKDLNEEKSIIFVRQSSNDLDADFLKQLNVNRDNILGYYDRHTLIPEIIIFYNNIYTDRYTKEEQNNIYKMTVMHELGHAVGLVHNSAKNTLMYPYYDDASETLTDYDLKIICIIYACNSKKLFN